MYVTSGSKIKTHYFNSLYFFTFERIFFHLKKVMDSIYESPSNDFFFLPILIET